MTAAQRRSAIYQQLTHADAPISATALAQQFSVTRQVVVGDIALLRAEGHSITATSRGYIIPAETGLIRTLAGVHRALDPRQYLQDCWQYAIAHAAPPLLTAVKPVKAPRKG